MQAADVFGRLGGFRIIKPVVSTRAGGLPFEALYGLYVMTLWCKDQQTIRETGVDPQTHYPTEEEFRKELRRYRRNPYKAKPGGALVSYAVLQKLALRLIAEPTMHSIADTLWERERAHRRNRQRKAEA